MLNSYGLIVNKSGKRVVEQLIAMLHRPLKLRYNPFSVDDLLSSMFVQTVGLSGFESALLREYYPDCLSQKELAFRLRKSESYVRKAFSGMYKKFHVANNAQLARLLTLSAMISFRRHIAFPRTRINRMNTPLLTGNGKDVTQPSIELH